MKSIIRRGVEIIILILMNMRIHLFNKLTNIKHLLPIKSKD